MYAVSWMALLVGLDGPKLVVFDVLVGLDRTAGVGWTTVTQPPGNE